MASNSITSKFSRNIRDIGALKNQLNNNKFLQKVYEEMVQTGKALLTFRNGNATVYYEGRQLCNMAYKAQQGSDAFYEPSIYNHYLPIVRSKTLSKEIKKENYIEEAYIKATNGMYDFSSLLPEILDNMDKERDDEAYQVSGFYRFSPLERNTLSTVILLDIEAAFAKTGEKTDRIDMVLYNTAEKRLMFVEVKRLTDSRLYPNPQTQESAEILKQLDSYKKCIANNKNIIIESYNKVIKYYNELCDSQHQIPYMDIEKAAEPLLGLLVVECSKAEQCNDENAPESFKALCEDIKSKKFKMFTYGNTKNATSGTMLAMYKAFK